MNLENCGIRVAIESFRSPREDLKGVVESPINMFFNEKIA